MSSLLGTLLRTTILDDAAYREWRERPNLFLRGIALILLVTLMAGLITFGVNLFHNVKPPDPAEIEDAIRQGFEQQYRFNPGWQTMDPQARQMMDEMIDTIVPMVNDIISVEAPLPVGVTGFLHAIGSWLSRALVAIGGWLLYGALVLIAVNLLGGSAKLPDFLGMVALYSIPALLGLFGPVPCLGSVLALIGMVWSIVVYVKAVSVAADLDGGKAVLAVVAPFVIIGLLVTLLALLWITWLIILF